MLSLYRNTAFGCSRLVTRAYSTSFSMGIHMLAKRFHDPIYGIYGFVRYADEIVDTFHDYDKALLLDEFKRDTYLALERRISTNPILHAYQEVVHAYGIPQDLTDAFLHSMEMDLGLTTTTCESYSQYIYGSAEVVGLMCLRVFCEGDTTQYSSLEAPARALGAAFQKVNFLRDVQSDMEDRGRVYFPGVDFQQFSKRDKYEIEADIEADFNHAFQGILRLPRGARFGVYVAYTYYLQLFKRIRQTQPERILQERIRVPDRQKIALLAGSFVRHKLNVL